MKFRACIFTLISLLFWSLEMISQPSDWNESIAPKAFKVTIPASVSFPLPSTDPYKIGFFIYNNGTSSFINVGQANYIPGAKIEIQIGYDATGATGYKDGDSLITLFKNTVTNDVYGMEFTFKSDKNRFRLNDSTEVSGVFLNTWTNYMPDFYFCQSSEPFIVPIPYGMRMLVLFTTGCHVDTSGPHKKIIWSKMKASTNNTFQIFDNEVLMVRTLYGFNLDTFPLSELNAEYEICPGNIVTVPKKFGNNNTLERTSTTQSFQLITPGQYTYTATYINGCKAVDTITVVSYAGGDCPTPAYSDRIHPNSGSGIVFSEPEKIKVLNSALEVVTEFTAPHIWNGLSSSGTPLPVGIYYIVHASGYTHEVSIIY